MSSRVTEKGEPPFITVSAQPKRIRRGHNQSRLLLLWGLISLLLLVLGLLVQPTALFFFWAFLIVWIIGACSVVLTSLRQSAYAKVLVFAVVIRLVLLIFIEVFPPISPPSSWRYVPGVIWQDETYYLSQARELGQSLAFFGRTAWGDPYERVAGFYAFFILLANDATIWGRLINLLIGAITSVILYDTMLLVTSPRTHRWIFWYAIASPVLLHFSLVYLKEGLLILGVSLLVNAAVQVYYGRRLTAQFLKIAIGIGLGVWVRNATLIPLLLPFVVVLRFPMWRIRRGRQLYVPLVVVMAIIIGMIGIVPLQTAQIVSTLFGIQGVGTMELVSSQIAQGTSTSSLPLFGAVMQLPEWLRGFGFLLLLVISPIITSVWSLVARLGSDDWWYVYAVVSYALSWWISIPFVIRAGVDSIRNRNLCWFAWSAALLVWLLIAANARFGVGYDAFRYRDSLLPVIMLLAAKGLDTTLQLKMERKGKTWRFMLRIYWSVIALLILLRAANLIGG